MNKRNIIIFSAINVFVFCLIVIFAVNKSRAQEYKSNCDILIKKSHS